MHSNPQHNLILMLSIYDSDVSAHRLELPIEYLEKGMQYELNFIIELRLL